MTSSGCMLGSEAIDLTTWPRKREFCLRSDMFGSEFMLNMPTAKDDRRKALTASR